MKQTTDIQDGSSRDAECTAVSYAQDEFVDGLLSAGAQPALFGHLSACRSCRERLESVMTFRRMSRLERLAVPPATDAAFMARLARHQAILEPTGVNAGGAQRWRWLAVSPRTAVIAATIVFALGMFVPRNASERVPPAAETSGTSVVRTEQIYVFYPGLVVRAVDSPGVPSE